ncbi:hypothetical protein RUM43_006143 [Polyplax serrata]|uniref:Uncharacterized protein n=1 Tax=Polyplax serrata TaxID=468196 RepID=A0AAN8PEH6_POLSC
MGFADTSLTASSAIFILGILAISQLSFESVHSLPDGLFESDFEYDTRPHDIGRMYTAEIKRLPVYDFGLGKRFDSEEKSGVVQEYDEYPYNEEDESLPELDLYNDDVMQSVEKRQNAYNFGLGKRHRGYDFGLGKRGRNRYDFGLGKRSSPYSRDLLYNMGLGKRTRFYSFGLGKRPSSQSAVGSRFNFGLGKRSDDTAKNSIMKREVQQDGSRAGMKEEVETSAKSNGTVHPGSDKPETSKKSVKSHLTKRSPYGYSMDGGSDPADRNAASFSRQFRKPLYNFGLGKRTSSEKTSDE